jgi:hypothetical protein
VGDGVCVSDGPVAVSRSRKDEHDPVIVEHARGQFDVSYTSEATLGSIRGGAKYLSMHPWDAGLVVRHVNSLGHHAARGGVNTFNLGIILAGHEQHDEGQGSSGLGSLAGIGGPCGVAGAALGVAGVAAAAGCGAGDGADDGQ